MFVEISSNQIASSKADAEEEQGNNHIVGHAYRDSQIRKQKKLSKKASDQSNDGIYE